MLSESSTWFSPDPGLFRQATTLQMKLSAICREAKRSNKKLPESLQKIADAARARIKEERAAKKAAKTQKAKGYESLSEGSAGGAPWIRALQATDVRPCTNLS